VLKQPKLAPMYQLVLSRDGHMDSLEVKVEVRAEVADGLPDGEIQSITRELQHQIKSYIGVNGRVNVLPPDTVERSMGKARRVVDNRPKD